MRGKAKYSKYTERIINFRDLHGETALHYATQQPNQVKKCLGLKERIIFLLFLFLMFGFSRPL